MKVAYGIVNDVGVTKPAITSELYSVKNDICKISAEVKKLERVQKKQSWQNALRCGKRRRG